MSHPTPRPAIVALKDGRRFTCQECVTDSGWVHLTGRIIRGDYPPGPLVERSYGAAEVRRIAWQPQGENATAQFAVSPLNGIETVPDTSPVTTERGNRRGQQ